MYINEITFTQMLAFVFCFLRSIRDDIAAAMAIIKYVLPIKRVELYKIFQRRFWDNLIQFPIACLILTKKCKCLRKSYLVPCVKFIVSFCHRNFLLRRLTKDGFLHFFAKMCFLAKRQNLLTLC